MYRHNTPRPHRGRGFGPGDDYMRWMGGPFPGFGPRGGRARKGDVREAILSLLAEAPSNGYGLITGIHTKTDGAWRPSPGSVYPTLQQLVDEGLIEPTSPGARAEYSLTDEGRAYVEENADKIAAAWEGSRRPTDHRELFQAAGKLAGVVRQVAAEGTPEQRTAAAEKLDGLRRELYRMLGE